MRLIIFYTMFFWTIGTVHLFAKEPQVVWGKGKEGAVVGVWHNTHMPGNGTITVYASQTTNYLRNLILPATEHQMLQITLYDTNNRPVLMTKEGQKYGQKLQTTETGEMKASHHLRNPSRFGIDDPNQIARFDINNCFKIEAAGDYLLKIQVRLLKAEGTNSQLSPVLFDSIKAKVSLLPTP